MGLGISCNCEAKAFFLQLYLTNFLFQESQATLSRVLALFSFAMVPLLSMLIKRLVGSSSVHFIPSQKMFPPLDMAGMQWD